MYDWLVFVSTVDQAADCASAKNHHDMIIMISARVIVSLSDLLSVRHKLCTTMNFMQRSKCGKPDRVTVTYTARSCTRHNKLYACRVYCVISEYIISHTHISMRMHAWRMHVWSCTRHNKLYACQRMQFWSYTIHNTLYACHQRHPCVIISLVKSFEQL